MVGLKMSLKLQLVFLYTSQRLLNAGVQIQKDLVVFGLLDDQWVPELAFQIPIGGIDAFVLNIRQPILMVIRIV